MEKIFAWISALCFGSFALLVIPYEGLILCLQLVLGAAGMYTGLLIFRFIRFFGKQTLAKIPVQFSVITYLFRKNSALSLEILNLRSDLKKIDTQLKDIVQTWTPVKHANYSSPSPLGIKPPALGRLDFDEKSSPRKKGEVINESFYPEYLL